MKTYIKPVSMCANVYVATLMTSPVGGDKKQNEPNPAPGRKLYV